MQVAGENCKPPALGAVGITRDELKARQRRIAEEIRNYPAPIPACDAQFNFLLEQRDQIARQLARMDESGSSTMRIPVQIRPARFEDCNDLGLVIVTATLSAFLGRVPEQDIDFSWMPQASAANWKRDFEKLNNSNGLFYVAESDGRVIGYVLAVPREPFNWDVSQLYVLPSAQRQGVGRGLLCQVARELHRRGVRSLRIGCVMENPSCGFYRRLGGVEAGRRAATVDRFQTEEILFVWDDLTVLIDPPATFDVGR